MYFHPDQRPKPYEQPEEDRRSWSDYLLALALGALLGLVAGTFFFGALPG